MSTWEQHLRALFALALLGAFVALGTRQLQRYQDEVRTQPYRTLAKRLNTFRRHEICDQKFAQMREYSSAVVDRFRSDIRAIWEGRGGGGQPNFSLLDLGPVKLRINPKVKPASGFDSTSWSWEEAYFLIQKIQSDPSHPDTPERWRGVDSMVRFLLEKDVARQLYGAKFLAPEFTEHSFRPNPYVLRTGRHEFTVSLVPGAFKGQEQVLQRLMEEGWRGNGFQVKVRWVPEGAYRIAAHSDNDRSFVDHKNHVLDIAHLSWTKTVVHELGHVLGFDDHYYNVWHALNCYYTQESRLGDVMSNSEKGSVTERHWEILDKAYPWGGTGPKERFSYIYGK